ncbi:MAG: hypothetical protein BMS9Abin07_1979 [Acidimicrobiia bacterium]|nr:MAG: hypothetical protein BMS9Abin07_1979 [Acidimicrobiia bacterium]
MTLQPYLFSSDSSLVAALGGSGPDRVGGVVVDWERHGKLERQAGARERIGVDTQINEEGPEELMEVSSIAKVPVLCRLNHWTSKSPEELETAIACGASEVLLPIVRTTEEVEAALDAARGRVGVGIMVETIEATRIADLLGEMPITRAFLGLMDLALERRSVSIFDAIADGTVERVRSSFEVPFGFAGLTVPGGGRPIPVHLLAGEMVRLGCEFSFLRRSFIGDSGDAPVPGLRSIMTMVEHLESRSLGEIDDDYRDLIATLNGQPRAELRSPAPRESG